MNRLTTYGLAWLALLFAGYSALVFLLFERTDAFWLAYGTTAFAFLVAGAVLAYFFSKRMEPRRQLYVVALARWTLLYGVAQTLASVAHLAFQEHIALAAAGCAYLLLFVAYGCLAIPAKAAEATLARQDGPHIMEDSAIRRMQRQLTVLSGLCQDSSAQQALQSVAEALRLCDPCPSPDTTEIEETLAQSVATLPSLVDRSDWAGIQQTCASLLRQLDVRNRLCKQTKR